MKKKIIKIVVSFQIVLILLSVACAPASEDNVWLDSLRFVPDETDTLKFGVVINDLRALRAALNIPIPTPDASVDELAEHKLRLAGAADLQSTNQYSPYQLVLG